LLGGTPGVDAALAPGFLQALGCQIELLITLHRNSAAQQSAATTLDDASSLSFDLFGQTDLREAMRSLIERAVLLSGAQSGTIYTIADDGYLELTISHGFQHDHSGTRLSPGQGLAGQVVLNRSVLILDDYQQYVEQLPQFENETLHACIGVPLQVQDELIGVLTLMHSRPHARFTPKDRALIESFARPAALVVRNAQLFAQQQQRARESTEKRGKHEQEQPPRNRFQLAAESDDAGERAGPDRDRVRRVCNDRIPADPEQCGKGDERAASGDRIDRAGEQTGNGDDHVRSQSLVLSPQSLVLSPQSCF